MPDEISGEQYYQPKMIGDEKRLNDFIEKVKAYELEKK
jgi:hypothetical protein